MAMATTQDQQSQGNGFSLPNIPTSMPNIPGVPKIGDALHKGGQKIEQAAQQAAKKLLEKGAAFLVANPEILVIAIVLIVVVVIFLIIITTIMGNSNGALPSAQPGPPPPTPGQTLTCSNGDYTNCLKNDFNIVVAAGTDSDLAKIYQAFAFAGKSSNYVSLLETGGNALKIIVTNAKDCSARTYGHKGTIVFSNGCFNLQFSSYRYLLIHESGHIINARNPRLFQSFPWTDYVTKDSSCYDKGYLKSYALRCGSRCGINPKDESFAEAIADSLKPYSYSGIPPAQPINNFAVDCPNTYSWFKTNIFEEYTYF